MAYIGVDINYGDIASQTATSSGSATPIATLDYSVPTSSSIMVTLDGVTQVPSVDFNVTSGTTLTFTSSVPSGVVVCVYFLGRSVDIGVPGDGTVSGTKIAMGSDAQGDVLYYNGSQYTRLAKGTAGQALVMNSGATAPEWGSAGGPSLGTDAVIRTNAKTIAENITFAGTENGMSAGPITINSGYTVTVTSGSTWTVVGA